MATLTAQIDDCEYNNNGINAGDTTADAEPNMHSESASQLIDGLSGHGGGLIPADHQERTADTERMKRGKSPQPRCPSPAADALDILHDHDTSPAGLDVLQEQSQPQACSTPLAMASTSTGAGTRTVSGGPVVDRPTTLSLNISAVQSTLPASPNETDSDSELGESTTSTNTVQSQTDENFDHELVEAPILGYEVMEQRARFTVFKIHVRRNRQENWFIFRRYTDFVRLNERLREMFPYFRLSLPPKKWFGDNFDREFVEDRMLGLQAFINNVIGHRDICNSEPVRQFFCFDDPPGPHDSLEESRAKCEALEDQVYNLTRELQERDAKMALMEEELALHKMEIENLRKSLRIERSLNNTRYSPSSQPSECSLTEQDQASCVEADRETPVSKTSSHMTSPDIVSITPSSDWDAASNGGDDVKMSKMKSKDSRTSRKNSSHSAHSTQALYQPAT